MNVICSKKKKKSRSLRGLGLFIASYYQIVGYGLLCMYVGVENEIKASHLLDEDIIMSEYISENNYHQSYEIF